MKFQVGRMQLVLALFWLGLARAPAQPVPVPNAHAHNDYRHPRPLLDALDQGFCSVEADIHLVNGQLLVAHDPDEVRSEATLQALYLEPLRQRVERHGGSVFASPADFQLLIDIKTEAEPAYQVLRRVLEKYQAILTRFGPDGTTRKAVTVIISGNRPIALMQAETERYAAVDGRLSDLGQLPPASLMPLISDNWTKHFTWKGEGAILRSERTQLHKLVRQVHASKRKLRLWATPDVPAMWTELRDAGVDYINTDDLRGLARFLQNNNVK